MFQFIRELSNANKVVEVLSNKTTKQIYITFYDFCRSVTTLISFTNVQVFNRFANFIFICSLKIKIELSHLCLIPTILR